MKELVNWSYLIFLFIYTKVGSKIYDYISSDLKMRPLSEKELSSQICSPSTEIYSSHIVLSGRSGVISMQVVAIWWLYREAEAVTVAREKS